MAEEITLKLTVDAVNAAASVKDLKQVIRDATNEALKFKEGSAEFAKFAGIAAQAKDKLGDVRQQMAALDPDAKTQSFMKLGSAMVGGFTAATSAAALFGANAEDVQKALLKVQAAMGLLQGFQAIQDGVQAFTALRGAVLVVISSMNAMKLAIAATGIGALVVGIGILISVLNAQTKATEEAAAAQDKLNKKLAEEANWLDFTLKIRIQASKAQLDLAKARGESLEKLQVLELAYVQAQIDALEELKTKQGFLNDDQILQKRSLNDQLTIIDLNYQADIAARNLKAFEDKKAVNSGETEYIKEQTEIGLLALTSIEQKALDKRLAAQKKYSQSSALIVKESMASQVKSMLADASVRVSIEQSVFSALANIGNATIKNQEKLVRFQKKVAAIQIIVSQVEALAAAVKAGADKPWPLNLVAIASGVAAVIGIFAGLSSLFSKAGDIGGSPSLDTSAGGVSMPGAGSASNVPSGTTFLEQPSTQLGNNTGEKPPLFPNIVIKNVISESEITSVQDRVSSITKQATIE